VSPRDIFPVFLVPQKAYNCTTLLLFLIKVKYLFTLISRYVITVDIKCRLLLKLIYETCPISVNATITTDITSNNGTLNGPSDFPYFTKIASRCITLLLNWIKVCLHHYNSFSRYFLRSLPCLRLLL
jgi:hypothetical protein